jgi:hypothetical protein
MLAIGYRDHIPDPRTRQQGYVAALAVENYGSAAITDRSLECMKADTIVDVERQSSPDHSASRVHRDPGAGRRRQVIPDVAARGLDYGAAYQPAHFDRKSTGGYLDMSSRRQIDGEIDAVRTRSLIAFDDDIAIGRHEHQIGRKKGGAFRLLLFGHDPDGLTFPGFGPDTASEILDFD